MSMFYKRQGQMGIYNTYFFTQTIQNFSHLLLDDNLKTIVINSLKYLVKKELINVYGYVIMPNHIHLLWSIVEKNGKESPSGSFSKFTAHEFKKYLTIPNYLSPLFPTIMTANTDFGKGTHFQFLCLRKLILNNDWNIYIITL